MDRETLSPGEMFEQTQPIAVFDSGVGGISVLKELVKVMPNEDFIYYGDSKHAPYGTKTLEEVRRLTILHTQELLSQGAKAVAIAAIRQPVRRCGFCVRCIQNCRWWELNRH